MTSPAPIEEGARARLTRDVPGYRAGFEFVVDEYVEPNPVDEREDGEIDTPHYYGNANGGSDNVFVPADAVEQVTSAKAMAARRPPSGRQILDALDLLGDWDDFETDESEPDGKGTTVYGKTADGLPFGFMLHVTAIWKTDL